jgi:hypothetical protein
MRIHPVTGLFPPGQGGEPSFKKDYAQMLVWGFTAVV